MKTKILVILDSGLDKRFLDDTGESNIIKYSNYTDEIDYDLNGHGTCVYNYVKRYNHNVQFVICKILNRFGKAKLDTLEKVLNDLLEHQIDVICMPFSIIKNTQCPCNTF